MPWSSTASCPSARRRSRHFPEWLDKRLVRGLHAQGIEMLYTHQREALDALRDGKDVVVVTPTASGKTLCYGLPVLQAVADDPAARALFLFPTKALSQDQLAAFRELTEKSDMDVQAGVYDGDTPGPIRTNIRTSGQVVVTNPDMLHSAILPHHTKWFQLFEQLRYIVVDETHMYRGIFGSHVANVLTRLLRLCAHYGSHPQIVCCSATIGNPKELAETLTGRPMTVIDRNGAPAGEKHVVILNPPVIDRAQRRPARPAGPVAPHGAELPARRSPDDRLFQGARRGRAAADLAARGVPRRPRTTEADPRLPRRLPAH